MIVYLECDPVHENALRALYRTFGVRGRDSRDDEGLGVMIADATGTRLITGTTRADIPERLAMMSARGSRAWLKIHDEWPKDWQYPS